MEFTGDGSRDLDVEELVARHVLDLIPSDAWPGLAERALRAGHDGPALRELAGERGPIASDIGRLVDRALDELGAARPTRVAAARLLAIRIAVAIASGTTPASEGAERIHDLTLEVPELGHAFDGFVYWSSELSSAEDEERRRRCLTAIRAVASNHADGTPAD